MVEFTGILSIVRDLTWGENHILHILLREFRVQIMGGYPLWLVGGADSYSDIDVYCNTWEQWTHVVRYLMAVGFKEVGGTRHTLQFQFHNGVEWVKPIFQIVQPGFKYFDDIDLLRCADLSPSACLLELNDGDEFEVLALYPEDIKNRRCRVLIEHEFTPYRIDQYRKKGYEIIPLIPL